MRRTDFIYLLFIFIGGCLSPVISHASTFMPIVTNYTAKDYQAGLQNWALAQGKNGEMYIGNNTGLLCFDGYTWSKYQMPGNQLVDPYSLMVTVFMWEHTRISAISAATLLVYLNTLPYGANSRISKHTMMKYGIYSK